MRIYADLHHETGFCAYGPLYPLFQPWQRFARRRYDRIVRGEKRGEVRLWMGDMCEFGRRGMMKEDRHVVQDIRDMLGEAYFVSGNHDLGYAPTQETVTVYESIFSPLFFSFVYDDQEFVVVSSTLYEATGDDRTARYLDQQRAFLHEKTTPYILCFHDPAQYNLIREDCLVKPIAIWCGDLHTPLLNFNKQITIIPSVGGFLGIRPGYATYTAEDGLHRLYR